MKNLETPLLARMGLVERSSRWRLTLWAWLWMALVAIATGFWGVRCVYPFLAVTDRVDTKVLVLEGWLPDYTRIDPVIREFNSGHYELIVVTGGPTPRRELLGDFANYPDLAKAILEKRGIDPNVIVAVPSLGVARDRTYASAVALRHWLEARRPPIMAFNLFTLGAHGRRSRLMFQEALGNGINIGIISSGDLRFDGARWWTSSAGVREILSEALAYLYARLIFHP
jgi:hypothetical protein